MTAEGLTSELPPAHSAPCCRCGRWTVAGVLIRHIERASGPGVALYACPEHALDMAPGPVTGELKGTL